MIVTTTKKLAKETKSLFRELPYNGFNVFGVTETKITNFNIPLDFDPSIPNYNFEYVPTPLSAGGGGMYIDNGLKYTVIEKNSNQDFQALWVTIHFTNKRDITTI